LPPVELHELLGDVLGVEVERTGGVVGALDGELRQGEQEGELVRRDERALGQDALDPKQECELIFSRRRRAHFAR